MHALHAPRSAPARPLRRRLAARVRASAAEGAPEERRLFSFGMGYTTLALAHVAKQQGWCVRAAASRHSRCCLHVAESGTCLARAATTTRRRRCAALASTPSPGAPTTGKGWRALAARAARLRNLTPLPPQRCRPGRAAPRHARRHLRAARGRLRPRPGTLLHRQRGTHARSAEALHLPAALVRCLLCTKRSCLKRRAPAARCAGWDISAARVRCAASRLRSGLG